MCQEAGKGLEWEEIALERERKGLPRPTCGKLLEGSTQHATVMLC